MEPSAERAFLAELEARLAAGGQPEVEASLTLLAGQAVELDEDELRGARRRAVQLLATGGDPRRGLDVEARAVLALASDLDTPERRKALQAGLASLRGVSEGLPEVESRLQRLLEDEQLAWRWYACMLLAEELAAD